MSEITDSVKINLIDLVQAQPCLWKMNSDVYHRMRPKEKTATWIKIASILGLESEYSSTFAISFVLIAVLSIYSCIFF